MGHQAVKDSGCVLQGSQETSSGGWALLQVCMSQFGGLQWDKAGEWAQQGHMEQRERGRGKPSCCSIEFGQGDFGGGYQRISLITRG